MIQPFGLVAAVVDLCMAGRTLSGTGGHTVPTHTSKDVCQQVCCEAADLWWLGCICCDGCVGADAKQQYFTPSAYAVFKCHSPHSLSIQPYAAAVVAVGPDIGGLDMHGGDDGDDMTGDGGADELAAAIHHHAQHHGVPAHLQHQALDPNALAMAAAQLAGVGGLPGQEGLGAAAGLDDPALVAAAAAAAQAQAQQEQLAALQAAVAAEQQQQE